MQISEVAIEKTRWWQLKHFLCSSLKLGEMIQLEKNHQLEETIPNLLLGSHATNTPFLPFQVSDHQTGHCRGAK